MLRLPLFCCTKYVDSPLTRGREKRVRSPAGGSTLITSAPRSESMRVQCGPARTRERSSTRIPDSGPVTPQTGGVGRPTVDGSRGLLLLNQSQGRKWPRHPRRTRPPARCLAATAVGQIGPCPWCRSPAASPTSPPPAPDRLAVTCGDGQLTRGELESRANRLARDLAARGVGTGDFVTIALPNSIDWFVAVRRVLEARRRSRSRCRPSCRRASWQAIVELAGLEGRRRRRAGQLRRAPTACPSATRRRRTSPTAPLPDAVSPGVEGADVGRLDRPAEADRVRRPGARRHRRAAAAAAVDPTAACVMPGPLYHNGPVVWSCQALLRGNHVVVLPALRRRGDARRDRALPRRRRLPRAHDDEAHLAAARRRAPEATTCRRCASCGTSPSRARRG